MSGRDGTKAENVGLNRTSHWLPGIVLGLVLGLIVFVGCTGASAAIGSREPPNAAGSASYGGTALDGEAPGFTLRDQRGGEVSLADFRGKVVILAFFDSRCVETCPLTAYEFRVAYRALSSAAPQVVFLAINVNPNFNDIRDVDQFTRDKHLDEIPTWHFVTGPSAALAEVAARYNILVQAQAGREDFEHTPGVFVIDQGGQRRWYLSVPLIESGLVAPWPGPLLHELIVRRVRELLGA